MAKNIPNAHKIYEHLPLQDPPNFTLIWIFGLKLYHLATLVTKSKQEKDTISTR
jgi:hypothetical protein